MIRTRFAPSPTGFLHIGGARTALFSYAYAKRQNGQFILRIEDTDIERSTKESVDSIIHAMDWLNLNYDEGPFYQTKRMERYKEVIEQLIAKGQAYHCYCSKEELDKMREEQKSKGLKAKYDRRCLHSPDIREDVKPVVRFKNPESGSVIWNDLIKGRIEIANVELDDLIIARSDGTPTYNFCVVVDDLDMQITHVVRGDDHINNTPRQINILDALGAEIPFYAHAPMILREDGQKMSKRHDAVSVMQYKDMGILPEALLNYLARLCWGHGDDEIFDINQFIQWFDLNNISVSPARFDIKKLYWVNAEHIKHADNQKLAALVIDILKSKQVILNDKLDLPAIIELVKPRTDNLNSLADNIAYFYQPLTPNQEDIDKHLTPEAINLLTNFANELESLDNWTMDGLKQLIKDFCVKYEIKMPGLGMPLRLKLCGTTQTPSFDAIIFLLGKKLTLERLKALHA
ncbi:MAG: glutamate--tRNA ligase [Burkholderiales bacterium]|jgi:glutamyl-tRNA synthetase|nr:glutamate--tRNA ligase [Burkholderiales bacterium]